MSQSTAGKNTYKRANGEIALSLADAKIADTRLNSKNGRIQKVLGADDTFNPAFKHAILNDYDYILERPYLETELKDYKRVINALKDNQNEEGPIRLLRKIHRDPTKFRGVNLLCPIWKNRRLYELTHALVPRYIFPAKSSNVHMLTIIFGFAENLIQLEQLILSERRKLDRIIGKMTKQKRGVVIAGCFEPDLKTVQELTARNSGNAKLLKHLGITPTDSGGWILTGHFVVVAGYQNLFRDILRETYPSFEWKRVQFDGFTKDKSLAKNTLDILGYAGKYPKPIFKYPTRGTDKMRGDELLNKMKSAFVDPTFKTSTDGLRFNLNTAIKQWSLFMDRLGEEKIYYAKESSFAQKWYSQSEWECIRENDDDLFEWKGVTMQKEELHRDTEFTSHRIKPHLKGKCRRIQTRNLRYDEEWAIKTDLGGGPYYCVPYSYDRWILKK